MQKMQNPYTPTTEEVRANYLPPRTEIVDADEQFDRWLAEVKAQAWEEGQISLLKYMGVPLYPSKSDEPRNPKQPLNPYRQGEEQ